MWTRRQRQMCIRDRDNGKQTDEFALDSGYISIVPVKHDFTDHNSIVKIQDWKL